MPFTSILYANGPGYVHINGTRGNITMVDYCKYTLMSFRCGTRLCWCVFRQFELMWLRLTHVCVFLWKAKRNDGVYGIHGSVFCFVICVPLWNSGLQWSSPSSVPFAIVIVRVNYPLKLPVMPFWMNFGFVFKLLRIQHNSQHLNSDGQNPTTMLLE